LELADEERDQLQRWARRHKSSQALALRSRIVLACASGLDNKTVAAQLGCAAATVGKAGFATFLYLEVLDASFSFDGVIGAFAISTNVLVIAAGLGIGAVFVRSMTVYLVRNGTLGEYRYLEHGAHWAIGALAAILLLELKFHIPEAVTGLLGLGFILAAFTSSLLANRRERETPGGTGDKDVPSNQAAPV